MPIFPSQPRLPPLQLRNFVVGTAYSNCPSSSWTLSARTQETLFTLCASLSLSSRVPVLDSSPLAYNLLTVDFNVTTFTPYLDIGAVETVSTSPSPSPLAHLS